MSRPRAQFWQLPDFGNSGDLLSSALDLHICYTCSFLKSVRRWALADTRISAVPGWFGSTLRRDSWWSEIFPVVIVLGGFGIYATLRAFEGKFFEWGPYLSPFYSPLIDPQHHWLPAIVSPALLILIFPLGFRTTCYYYRK